MIIIKDINWLRSPVRTIYNARSRKRRTIEWLCALLTLKRASLTCQCRVSVSMLSHVRITFLRCFTSINSQSSKYFTNKTTTKSRTIFLVIKASVIVCWYFAQWCSSRHVPYICIKKRITIRKD